jgi:hypothetical protein
VPAAHYSVDSQGASSLPPASATDMMVPCCSERGTVDRCVCVQTSCFMGAGWEMRLSGLLAGKGAEVLGRRWLSGCGCAISVQ